MEQVSLSLLFKKGVFTAISKLRANENSYPFVTLVGKHGSNNVYFGKKSAAIIGAKYAIGDTIIKELADASIVLAKNEKGEMRYKLSLQGTTDYSSESELMSLFGGITPDELNFNVENFLKEFTTVEAAPAGSGAQNENTPKLQSGIGNNSQGPLSTAGTAAGAGAKTGK